MVERRGILDSMMLYCGPRAPNRHWIPMEPLYRPYSSGWTTCSPRKDVMEVTGQYVFDAPVERVWNALLNTDNLAHCLPGCEDLVPLGDDKYQANLSVSVGPIKGSYTATITVANQVPLSSYNLIVEGDGSHGFIRGQVLVSLEELGDKTTVTVNGEANVGGTVAMVGQRLMGGVNKMMMDRLFTCLQEAAKSDTL